MDKIIIQGSSNPLVGSVKIEGAKNAVLPLLAATILATTGKTTLTNVPVLSDVFTMNNVVRGLNTKVIFEQEENRITVDATQPLSEEAPYKYVSKMRASIVVLGPILARNGYAKVSMPGGCTIGSRHIDLNWRQWELKLSRRLDLLRPKLTDCMELIFTWIFQAWVQRKIS